jgi:hypothetical protein
VALCAGAVPSAGTADPPSGASPPWRHEVQQRIADAEYEVSPVETVDPVALASPQGVWQAPNRAQGLRTYFTEDGIRVVPRAEPSPSWEWTLTLAGWGRPAGPVSASRDGSEASGADPTEALAPAQLRVEGARVHYDRGGLTEWYVNERRGLEQGFTLAAPPRAKGSRVRIDLALGGTLLPAFSEDGQAVDFATPQGARVLHYASLVVRDAAGRTLHSWMEGFVEPDPARGTSTRGIRIVFEDADAVYPVTVDPLATSAAWSAESDQADAFLGQAVAAAGDVNGDGYSDVIVGAWKYDNGQTDEGRAFVYLGSASGLAITPAWNFESNQQEAHLGKAVGTAGDIDNDGDSEVIVGAQDYSNGNLHEGKAFLFRGSPSGLETTPFWTAEANQDGASFGSAVGTAGDVNNDGLSDVIVGAYAMNNVVLNEGVAFVYYGTISGPSLTPSWTTSPGVSGAAYGISAGTAGDVNGDGYSDVIVGAFRFTNGQNQEGKAYVYQGSSSGLSTIAAWTFEGNQTTASVGYSVGTAGDVNGDGFADIIVGSYGYTNGEGGEGRAIVFLGSGAGLSISPSWSVEANQASASMGYSVGTAGDVNGDGYADVIVGAPSFDNGESNEGRAFVFFGSAGGLSSTPAWTAEADLVGADFGSSVHTAGDVNGDGYSDVLVGADQYTNGENQEGRALVYLGSAAGPAASPAWSAEGEQAGAFEGWSVASAGDVNGDSYADVIVGIPFFDGGQSDEGRAHFYFGGPAGLGFTPAWTTESNNPGAQYGSSVGTAGDVNGDGYAEVIVGAPYFDNGQLDEGRAVLYAGGPGGPSVTATWTTESNQSNALFGWCVGTAGDINGDGYADVLVSAETSSNGQLNEGRVFVYHGAAAGLPTTPAIILERNQGGATFGYSAGTAGDVDADGYSDVIVGAPFFDAGQSNEGRAFVYRGSASGLTQTPAWTTESNQADADYGRSVATAGDVNGDGFADVIVGAPESDDLDVDEGRAYFYLGSASGLSTTPVWVPEGDQAGAKYGVSVATAGDVNGDGFADVLVGADGFSNGEAGEGRAFLYLGSAAGPLAVPAWTVEGNQAGAQLGRSVASAGDVDGDAYADVLVGAPSFDDGDVIVVDRGIAFLYYGNGGRGIGVTPHQRRPVSGGPIARMGASDDPDTFRLALLGRTPFGRGWIALESEVKPLGSILNGAGTTVTGQWTISGTSGVLMARNVTDPALAEGRPAHWRARLRYRPTMSPYQGRGRWVTIPWSGWNETLVRTAFVSSGRVPDGSTGTPLRVFKSGASQIQLTWGASCLANDTDYEIYEGAIAKPFAGHASRFCTTSGALSMTFTPAAGSAYYLVVPRNGGSEGSYGTTSAGAERPAGVNACAPRKFAGCSLLCSGGQHPGASCTTSSDCTGGCTGMHFGQSCTSDAGCPGQCGPWPDLPCFTNSNCRVCNGDHTVHCIGGQDCQVVGGPCQQLTCGGAGTCTSPVPGTCVLP